MAELKAANGLEMGSELAPKNRNCSEYFIARCRISAFPSTPLFNACVPQGLVHADWMASQRWSGQAQTCLGNIASHPTESRTATVVRIGT